MTNRQSLTCSALVYLLALSWLLTACGDDSLTGVQDPDIRVTPIPDIRVAPMPAPIPAPIPCGTYSGKMVIRAP